MLGQSFPSQILEGVPGFRKRIIPTLLGRQFLQQDGGNGVLFGGRQLLHLAECFFQEIGHGEMIRLGATRPFAFAHR